ncbi:MAG: Holliday junction DNA helicase RuvA [Brockia lithotrophica]|uniref:Holliday junction branch migration complex subunit RuvA n=1 Tax=Brockia lithotrophica TaxID=933949 RepID=A0A2T5G798_9BACL|nr:MAG: Holliday junction DNA helicase RuvA [Brockia lithotrophica]
MIDFLRGRLVEEDAEGVVLEVGGIGFRLRTPRPLGLPRGNEVLLYTHLVFRERDVELYGFSTPEERRLFLLLLGVGGVGPRSALSALAAFAPSDLAWAIVREDRELLRRIPGIGEKLAARLILELRDRLRKELGDELSAAAPEEAAFREVLEALYALGFRPEEVYPRVRVAIAEAGEDPPDANAILRRVLRSLSRRERSAEGAEDAVRGG